MISGRRQCGMPFSERCQPSMVDTFRWPRARAILVRPPKASMTAAAISRGVLSMPSLLRFPEIGRQQGFPVIVNATATQSLHTYEMRKSIRSNAQAKAQVGHDDTGQSRKRVWLEQRLNELKALTRGQKSKRGLAIFLNKPPSRITEMVAGTYRIEATMIKPLAEYLELSEDVILAHISGNNLKAAPLHSVRVIGAVEAGAWRGAVEWEESEWYAVPVATTAKDKYGHLPQFGLEVVGSSSNELWPDGSIIICVKLADLGRDPEPGEKVVVLRRRSDGLVEITARELRRSDDGSYWLWPRSTDPAHQQPWRIAVLRDSSADIQIVALVIRSIRNEA